MSGVARGAILIWSVLRVWGLGFRGVARGSILIWSVLRVWGLGFRGVARGSILIWSVFRVWGLGFRVSNTHHKGIWNGSSLPNEPTLSEDQSAVESHNCLHDSGLSTIVCTIQGSGLRCTESPREKYLRVNESRFTVYGSGFRVQGQKLAV